MKLKKVKFRHKNRFKIQTLPIDKPAYVLAKYLLVVVLAKRADNPKPRYLGTRKSESDNKWVSLDKEK